MIEFMNKYIELFQLKSNSIPIFSDVVLSPAKGNNKLLTELAIKVVMNAGSRMSHCMSGRSLRY